MTQGQVDKRFLLDVAAHSILQLTPYGGMLSSAWSAYKQEKTNLRLENFIAALRDDFSTFKADAEKIKSEELEGLGRLIDSTLEKIHSASSDEKLDMFRRFIESAVRNPGLDGFDEREVFLNDLADMSLLEVKLLVYLFSQNNPVMIIHLPCEGVDVYATLGAVTRLKGRGFIESSRGNYMMNGVGDESLLEIIRLSGYGRKFVNFCLPT